MLREVAGGAPRDFVFHPADRRAAVIENFSWASDRCLMFQIAGRTALVDATALKMSFPEPPGGEPGWIRFNADFTSALATNGDGVFLARVEPEADDETRR